MSIPTPCESQCWIVQCNPTVEQGVVSGLFHVSCPPNHRLPQILSATNMIRTPRRASKREQYCACHPVGVSFNALWLLTPGRLTS